MKKMIQEKRVALWGMGYLGYTKLLRLQSKGFFADVFDFTDTGFSEKIRNNDEYLTREQAFKWSETGIMPSLDIEKIAISSIDVMFKNNVHICAFPLFDIFINKNYLKSFTELVISNRNQIGDDTVFIFLSASRPGFIGDFFIKSVIEAGIKVNCVSAFRSDWTIDEFLHKKTSRTIAANSNKALECGMGFYDILGIECKSLNDIREAEIYENAKNCFEYMSAAFINQLSIGYPNANLRKMTQYLLEDIELNDTHLGIGCGGLRMPNASQNIIQGSIDPKYLSLIYETQKTNLNIIFYYAEIMKKRKYKTVTILGITSRGNQMSLELSPSLLLAEHLLKIGITVFVDDPFYNAQRLPAVLPCAQSTDILKDGISSDALIVMIDHNKFKFITQKIFDSMDLSALKLIIDNTGLYRVIEFPEKIIYHAIGDGSLARL